MTSTNSWDFLNPSLGFHLSVWVAHLPLILVGLDAPARLEGEVLVLHRPHVPPLGRRLELQLEGLVVADLVLVGGDVHTCNFKRGVSIGNIGVDGRLEKRLMN